MTPSDWCSTVYEVNDNSLKPSQRTALLHEPANYDGTSPAPLIVALHGKAQSAAEFENHTDLSNSKTNNEAIVVYPEGVKQQWLGDPEAPTRDEIDDILFIRILLDKLQYSHYIDATRIYCVGFSNGGGLADLLASDHDASARFAAFAISSGAFYHASALKGVPLFEHCNPARVPIPILEFHGDADPVIHYDGKSTPDGETFSLTEWLDKWAEKDDCPRDAEREQQYDGEVTKFMWRHGANGGRDAKAVLVHYLIRGFGHGWPTPRKLNNDDQRRGPTRLDATPIVMDFLSGFRLER